MMPTADPGSRVACQRRAAGTADARRATPPATTGDATDVPLRARHPSPILEPMTSRPYATTSGLTRPVPRGSSQVVMPRDEKAAIASSQPMPPTPITSGASAGLLSVP